MSARPISTSTSPEARQFSPAGAAVCACTRPVELVVVEATGRYHRALHQSLHACGLPVAGQSAEGPALRPGRGPDGKDRPLDASMAGPGHGSGGDGTARRGTTPARRPVPGTREAGRGQGRVLNANREFAVTAHMIGQFEQQIARLEDAIRTLIANNPESPAAPGSCSRWASARSPPPCSAPRSRNSAPSTGTRRCPGRPRAVSR